MQAITADIFKQHRPS